MIRTSKQLKDKVRNISGNNMQKDQTLLRIFVMERFLERVSLSPYKNNFVLKGGMLIAAFTGLDLRSTMDIDTTIQAAPISLPEIRGIIEEIIQIQVDDGVTFRITGVIDIMEEHEYPGVRFMLEGQLDRMRQPIQIDITTGDVIVPKAIEYSYKLMFEDRTISLMAYNMETVLAEKLDTVLARGIANTRMRDFYDIYILFEQYRDEIDYKLLKDGLAAVCEKRGHGFYLKRVKEILKDIEQSEELYNEWERYKNTNYYVGNVSWEEILESLKEILLKSDLN